MSKVMITRRIEFDYGHRVPSHMGKCFYFHGHRGVVEAEFAMLNHGLQTSGPADGMVADFGFIKGIMTHTIDEPVDHGMIMSIHDPWLVRMLPVEYHVLFPSIQKMILEQLNEAAAGTPSEAVYWYNKNLDMVNRVWFQLGFNNAHESTRDNASLFAMNSLTAASKLYVIPNAPTAEVLAKHFLARLNLELALCLKRSHPDLVGQVLCQTVRWYETPNCSATAHKEMPLNFKEAT